MGAEGDLGIMLRTIIMRAMYLYTYLYRLALRLVKANLGEGRLLVATFSSGQSKGIRSLHQVTSFNGIAMALSSPRLAPYFEDR